MADITAYINNILNAAYGEQVRGSIAEALRRMNTESSNASSTASEASTNATNAVNAANAAKKRVDEELDFAAQEAAHAAEEAWRGAQAAEEFSNQAFYSAGEAAALLSVINEAASTAEEYAKKASSNAKKAEDYGKICIEIRDHLEPYIVEFDKHFALLKDWYDWTNKFHIDGFLETDTGVKLVNDTGSQIGQKIVGVPAFMREFMELQEKVGVLNSYH